MHPGLVKLIQKAEIKAALVDEFSDSVLALAGGAGRTAASSTIARDAARRRHGPCRPLALAPGWGERVGQHHTTPGSTRFARPNRRHATRRGARRKSPGFRRVQPSGLLRGRTAEEDQAADRGRRRPHHPVSVLHQRAHAIGNPPRCQPAGNHGGDLGRRRNARRRRIRPLDPGARDGRSRAPSASSAGDRAKPPTIAP